MRCTCEYNVLYFFKVWATRNPFNGYRNSFQLIQGLQLQLKLFMFLYATCFRLPLQDSCILIRFLKLFKDSLQSAGTNMSVRKHILFLWSLGSMSGRFFDCSVCVYRKNWNTSYLCKRVYTSFLPVKAVYFPVYILAHSIPSNIISSGYQHRNLIQDGQLFLDISHRVYNWGQHNF